MTDAIDDWPTGRLLSVAARLIEQRWRERLDEVGLTHAGLIVLHLLAERFKATQAVGRLKAASGMPPSDPGREREQVARLRALASDSHLDPEFAEKWFTFVVAEVIHHHERLASGGDVEA
jgi:chorismate mutase